jgi:hypothetical protein
LTIQLFVKILTYLKPKEDICFKLAKSDIEMWRMFMGDVFKIGNSE